MPIYTASAGLEVKASPDLTPMNFERACLHARVPAAVPHINDEVPSAARLGWSAERTAFSSQVASFPPIPSQI